MLQPAKSKYKKAFKGRIRGNSSNANKLAFGSYGLMALSPSRITGSQLESVRKVISKYVKRKGKMWFRIFPNIPVSKKPTDVRMGKGKGSVEFWVFRVKPGRMILEVEGLTHEQAAEALVKASAKLPLKTSFISNDFGGIR